MTEEQRRELIAAAKAVVARWDSPLWRVTEPTAAVVHRLRLAVEAAESTEDKGE